MQAPVGHILVVDDDPMHRRYLTATLQREGHRASSVGDGEAALTALVEDPPDVVLLDLVMPGLDGVEVLERIKADPATRHLPVIVISGVEDTDRIVRCLEMGADDFLPKPANGAILRARVNAGLMRKAFIDIERERVRTVFARFLPEPVVDEVLSRSDGEPTIEAEEVTATVLFADLRGFTTFAEDRPAGDVIAALNRYLGAMTDAVLDDGGTLIATMGDGIIAAFGAPLSMPDHADRAIAAATSMLEDRLPAFNAWLAERGIDPFAMGIGINSGTMMSGSVGSDRRLDYTIIGDTVNSASRIEGLTKETPFPALIADPTYQALTGPPPEGLTHAGEFEVRGRASRVELWGLMPANGSAGVTGSDGGDRS